jgi:hypothetical protein
MISDFSNKLLDENLLDIYDLAFLANSYRSIIDFYNVDIYDANAQKFKNYLTSYIDQLFSKSSEFKKFITDKGDIEYDTSHFNLKIYKSKTQMRLLQQAGISNNGKVNNFIDYSDCESLLRAQYDLPTVIVKILQYNSNIFNSAIKYNPVYSETSASVSFYNPTTLEKLNSSICNSENKATIYYRFSLQQSTRMNMILYRKFDEYSDYEPFDLNNKYYQSRCYTVLDSLYQADTSINYRRKHYFQNLQGVCSNNCRYLGIDLDNYVNCECDNVGDDIIYYFKDTVPEDKWTINLDIVTCPFVTFRRPAIHINPGFYVGIVINCLAILGLGLLCLRKHSVITGSNIENLYYFDHFTKRGDGYLPANLTSNPKEVELVNKNEYTEKIGNNSKSLDKNDSNKNCNTDEVVLETHKAGENLTLFTTVKRDRLLQRDAPKKSGGVFDNTQGLTLADVNNLWAWEVLRTDNRSCMKTYFDYLSERTFFSLFLKTSAIEPTWVRFTYALMFLSILFTINAMMYSDEYIDARIPLPQPIRVSIDINHIGYIPILNNERDGKSNRWHIRD